MIKDLASIIQSYERVTLTVYSYRDSYLVPCKDVVDITGVDQKEIVAYLSRHILPYMKNINNKNITLSDLCEGCMYFYSETQNETMFWSKIDFAKIKDSIDHVLNVHFRGQGARHDEYVDLLDEVDPGSDEYNEIRKEMEDDEKYFRIDIFLRLKNGSTEDMWNILIDVDHSIVIDFLRSTLPPKLMMLM